jgi:hypothetical protein
MIRTRDRVFQFKATLRNISPPIWRRVQVLDDCTLHQLHAVLQVAMGWENYHEYEFIVVGRKYGLPAPEDYPQMLDAKRARISDVLPTLGIESEYIYDFGDSWHHDLQLEGILTAEPDAAYPRCLDGARNCPPEDVGGVSGYEDYLAALADPNHEAHDEMTAWRSAFDPEAFSIEKVNQRLAYKFHSARKRNSAVRHDAARRESSTEEELRQAVASLRGFPPLQQAHVSADERVFLERTQGEHKLIESSAIMESSPDELSAFRNKAHGFGAMEHLQWSQAEKKVARTAFDLALKRELGKVMVEVKKRAEKIKQPPDLWNLEHYLTECRKRIDRKFDYRYSVLIQVFGELLHRGQIREEDLRGLGEDKLAAIRRFASFLSSPLGWDKQQSGES